MTLNFSHRPANLEDLPQICTFPQNPMELYFMYPKATFPLTYDRLKFNFDNRSNCTVFLTDETVVAFANMYDIEPGKQCFLGNVIINPAFRGQGVGEYLLDTMAEIAVQTHQAKELHLTCFNTNTPALLLYLKTGFTPYAMEKRMDFDGKSLLAVHMKKVLDFYVI
jgi:ribosomal protein S18 acetylase RimI-like enzyme